MFFLLYKTYWWQHFWWFSEDFQPLSEDFRRFFKIVLKARRTFPKIFWEFPKISEDVRRLPKTFEEDPKMFRWYTNEFINKYNLRDKLDITEIDIFRCEDIISSHVRISYRFCQFVTTRYTTDFYIIKSNMIVSILQKQRRQYTMLSYASLAFQVIQSDIIFSVWYKEECTMLRKTDLAF